MNKNFLYGYNGCDIFEENGTFTVYRYGSYWGFAPTTWEAEFLADSLNRAFNN